MQSNESGTQVRQTTFGYGLEGELLSRSGSAELVTLQYDGAYRTVQLADGNSHATQASYNTQGYLAAITYPGNTGGNADKIQFNQYDNDGDCLVKVDGNGLETDALFHDADNLLTNIQYPATPGLNVSFSYDGYSRRQGMTDSTGSVAYSWDDDDDITQVATTYTGLPQKSISYTLNPDGSRASMVTPAGTFSYLYENDGHLSSLTNPYSETSSWSYLDNGWLQKQTLGNGANANWTYNARGFVTRLQNLTSTSATLSDFGGTGGILSDSLGNPTSLPASVPGSTAASGTTSYTYNSSNELTQEQSGRNGSYTNSFGYDPAFNPTTWKGSAQSFNSDNQNSAFVFDGNGNPTSYNGNSVSWDPENRLTAYGSLLTAGYNGDDLRAWKQSASGRTYFLYDGSDPVVEMDGSGNVTAVNTFGAAGLVSRHTSAGSVFYTFDSQGSTVERLDSSQNVLSTDVFDSFGKLLSGPTSDPWGYEAQDGYFTDTETGLISLSFRYYDPAQGRFLNRDPIGFDGGINLYGYVDNRPLSLVDPTGRGGEAAVVLRGGIQLGGAVGLFGGGPFDPFSDTAAAAIVIGTVVIAGGIYVYENVTNDEATAGAGPYDHLEDPPNVAPGKNFTPSQKKKSGEANREKNGGNLCDDVTGEELVQPVKSQKGVSPPPNEAQWDHVLPKHPADSSVQPGSNSYGNLHIRSRRNNRAKSNQ